MADTSTALLDAVGAVIDRDGPSGVTLRKVGEQAGLSHTAMAHYFGDRPGLFTAYIARAWSRLTESVRAAGEHRDPAQAVVEAAVAYAEFAADDPAAFSVMHRLDLARRDNAALTEAVTGAQRAFADVVARATANGWGRGRPADDLYATLWGLVHGATDLASAGLWRGYTTDPITTIRRLVDTLVRDLAANA